MTPHRREPLGAHHAKAEVAPWLKPQAAGLEHALQRVVQRWVARTLVMGALGGCYTAAEPLEVEDAGQPAQNTADSFQPKPCDAEGRWTPLASLTTPERYDAMAMRTVYPIESFDPILIETLHSIGTPCVGATDASCATAYAERPRQCIGLCPHGWLSTTQGTQVQHYPTWNGAVLELLGPIDSPADALLLLYLDGYLPGYDEDVECDTETVRAVSDGFEVFATKRQYGCGVEVIRFRLHVALDGAVSELEQAHVSGSSVCMGRRPEGLCDAVLERGPELGAFFARNAHLEAASVHAFDRMIEELLSHGAPRELIDEAQRARDDEVRHAQIVGELAHSFGARVPELRVEPRAPRPLLAMAIENAVEGCVRETWGAVVGSYQAARAQHAQVASVLREIAADEQRHAALSWKLAAWLDARLTPLERAEVMRAYRAAIAELHSAACAPPDPQLGSATGLPDKWIALGLLAELDATLWANA